MIEGPVAPRHAESPSPLWGGVTGGGNPYRSCSAIPPSLTLPHVVSKTRLRHDEGGETIRGMAP